MQKMFGLAEEALEKSCIVFDLEDVLIFGSVSTKPNKEKIIQLLKFLSALEKKFSSFRLFLVSGYSEKEGRRILSESGLESFFKPENVFFVSKDYIDSMQEVDRKRYEESIEKNVLFQDDYFKQTALEKIVSQMNCKKEQVVFVCHDLLTDAYYSQRFSRVDVALVKYSLSLKHEKQKGIVKGLLYVRLDVADFKKLLLGKKPKPDYSLLKKFIERYLQRELLGSLQIDASALMVKKENN